MVERFIVGAIIKQTGIKIMGSDMGMIDLQWFDGMVGISPVFITSDKAAKYIKSMGFSKDTPIITVMIDEQNKGDKDEF